MLSCNMATEVCIPKQVLLDLFKEKEKFDARMESIELMTDQKFMESNKKAKDQIKQKDFDDWNGL